MEQEFPNSFKISVIGCGSVGATTAYSLLLPGIPTHLTLIDIRKEQAEGLDLDLEHSTPFTPSCRIKHSRDVKDCKNSDLVVITAGKRQSPGQTRLDLIKDNKKIFADIIPKIAKNIKEDSHQVFPLSVLLQNYYGHSKVCLSIPATLSRKGINELIEIPLDKSEQKNLAKSVSTLKSYQ